MPAVLFDVDGVLLDTGSLFTRVWTEWAVSRGLDPASVLPQTYGRRPQDTLAAVAPGLDPEEESRELDRLVMLEIEQVTAMPGALDLLSRLKLPWAVVTSGTRWFVESCLRAAGLPVPEVAVYGEDVVHGKPAPEPYLTAAYRLETPPHRCVVIEDSPHGIAAAKAAGCSVIALLTTHQAADLTGANVMRSTLAEVGELLETLTTPPGAVREGEG
jgi:sugar-phosphatase